MAEFFRLKKAQRVEPADGRTVTVTDKLVEGEQGVVYRVRFVAGEPFGYVMKIYPTSYESFAKSCSPKFSSRTPPKWLTPSNA